MTTHWPSTVSDLAELDLTYINDTWSEANLRDGIRAVIAATKKTQPALCIWEYMSTYSPNEMSGFMFSYDHVVSKIQREMEFGHSGASMAWVMRHIEYIAKNGLNKHKQLFQ